MKNYKSIFVLIVLLTFGYAQAQVTEECNTPAPVIPYPEMGLSACSNYQFIVNDLIEILSHRIKSPMRFYENETGGDYLPINSNVSEMKNYYVSQIVDGCESKTRTSISFWKEVYGTKQYSFPRICSVENKTLSDLMPSKNSDYPVYGGWYNENREHLPSNTPLIDGETYYFAESDPYCMQAYTLNIEKIEKPTVYVNCYQRINEETFEPAVIVTPKEGLLYAIDKGSFQQSNVFVGINDGEHVVKVYSNGCEMISDVFEVKCGIKEPIINIPDIYFKKFLTNQSRNFAKNQYGQKIIVDKNNDGEIQLSEAQRVYYINLYFYDYPSMEVTHQIRNIDGLQYFENLKEINAKCSYIDECGSKNPLDVSKLNKLKKLSCNDGGCSYFKIENSLTINELYFEMDYTSFKGCNNLSKICVSDGVYDTVKNMALDYGLNPTISKNCVKEPVINIPDNNLISQLVGDPLINLNDDSEIQVSEALNVRKLRIYCIQNAEGLQYFENLTELETYGLSDYSSCRANEPVDLSHLKYLTKFKCFENGCSYVNLENNLSLKHVDIEDASNNFKGCYNLETFRARYSYLDLDFTNFTKLKSINSYVSINSLKIKGCTSLEAVELEADYNIKSLDFSDCVNLKSLSIYESGKLTELNLNNVNKLEKLVVSASNLDYLDLSNMPNLKTTYIAYGINNLNIKNGSLFTVEPNSENGYKEGLNLEYASDLKSICVDEGEYEFVKSLVEKYGYKPIITTDCTNLSVSKNEWNVLNITFSPNPTQGKITFTENVDEVKVFDLSGRLVKTNALNTTEVDLSDLQKGVYMLQVNQNNKTFTAKVVKE
jgi:hypothetical protein